MTRIEDGVYQRCHCAAGRDYDDWAGILKLTKAQVAAGVK